MLALSTTARAIPRARAVSHGLLLSDSTPRTEAASALRARHSQRARPAAAMRAARFAVAAALACAGAATGEGCVAGRGTFAPAPVPCVHDANTALQQWYDACFNTTDRNDAETIIYRAYGAGGTGTLEATPSRECTLAGQRLVAHECFGLLFPRRLHNSHVYVSAFQWSGLSAAEADSANNCSTTLFGNQGDPQNPTVELSCLAEAGSVTYHYPGSLGNVTVNIAASGECASGSDPHVTVWLDGGGGFDVLDAGGDLVLRDAYMDQSADNERMPARSRALCAGEQLQIVLQAPTTVYTYMGALSWRIHCSDGTPVNQPPLPPPVQYEEPPAAPQQPAATPNTPPPRDPASPQGPVSDGPDAQAAIPPPGPPTAPPRDSEGVSSPAARRTARPSALVAALLAEVLAALAVSLATPPLL